MYLGLVGSGLSIWVQPGTAMRIKKPFLYWWYDWLIIHKVNSPVKLYARWRLPSCYDPSKTSPTTFTFPSRWGSNRCCWWDWRFGWAMQQKGRRSWRKKERRRSCKDQWYHCLHLSMICRQCAETYRSRRRIQWIQEERDGRQLPDTW